MLFRSINLPKHTLARCGKVGRKPTPAGLRNNGGNMKEIKYNKIKPEVNNTGYGGYEHGEMRLVGKPDSWKSRQEKEWNKE